MNLDTIIQVMQQKVPPVPPPDFQREPLEPAWDKAVPRVPPVPPEKSKVETSTHYQARPHVAIEELPARLVIAASRVCVELHNDDDEAVQAMLTDLCRSDPKDWNALIDHFEAQLPPVPMKVISMVTCSGCSHAEPSPNHPAIVHCRAGVESGTATAGWLDTDLHLCDHREVRV